MEALQSVALPVLELFALIALGWGLARYARGIPREFWGTAARFAYAVALPALIVHAFARFTWSAQDLTLFVAAALCNCLTIGGAIGVVACTKLPRATRFLIAAIAPQGNTVFLGFPLTIAVFGSEALPYAIIIVMTVILFEVPMGAMLLSRMNAHDRFSARAILRTITTDPAILACLVGLIWSLSAIPYPEALSVPMKMLGDVAPPLGLITVGARLSAVTNGGWQPLCLAGGLKLILAPALAYAVTLLIPLPEELVRIFVVLSAVPIAVSTISQVAHYKGDIMFTANAVSLTTLASLVTLPFIAYLLS